MRNLIGLLFLGLMTFSYSQAQAGNLFKEIFSITDAANGQNLPLPGSDPNLADLSGGSEAQMLDNGGDSLLDPGSGYAPYSTATGNGKVSH